jgi:23S rRNA pseudouridine2605 synthase
MTDRSDRSASGKGRQRTAKPGTKPASKRGAKARPEPRPEGAPQSKRFGRRPPKAVREGGAEAAPRRERPADPRSERSRGPGRPWSAKRPGKPAGFKRPARRDEAAGDDGLIRLNRYLAMSGVASRRDADALIKAGVVTVNGQVVTELGTKVRPEDKVHYGGQRLSRETKRYVLLNKPKDFITTTDDPHDRRTVMALVEHACAERLYPVGRLDRQTTGLLLLTNDGDLAKKLTHPSHGAEKLYHVTLDKSVAKADLEKLTQGIQLEDGPAQADEASYVQDASKREVGLKLHMGRNRIVRRMFEALGYEVVKLDRVMFAGLTKKDLPRSKWRHLSEKEVTLLKRMR